MTESANEAASIAQRWIEYFSTPEKERRPEIADNDSWYDLPRESPDLCYDVVLEAVRVLPPDTSNRAFQAIAAGPLEDLLAMHGQRLIERVEVEARRNPRFNLLLGGVWQNEMTPEIWSRVQAARLQQW